MTINDFKMHPPPQDEVVNGNISKTLPDVDSNGGFFLARFIDWCLINEVYDQLRWFLKVDYQNTRPPVEHWGFDVEVFNTNRRYYDEDRLALTNTYLPILDSHEHSDVIYLSTDPLQRYSEKTPTRSANFDNRHSTSDKVWTNANFELGGVWRDDISTLWDYTRSSTVSFTPSPCFLADDMRKIYLDMKKFSTDIYTLHTSYSELFKRADGCFSKPYADSLVSNDRYNIHQNGGVQQRTLYSRKNGWSVGALGTWRFLQRYVKTATSYYDGGGTDPEDTSHWEYNCIDQYNIEDTTQETEKRLYYYVPVFSTAYASLLKSYKVLFDVEAHRKTYQDYAESGRHIVADTTKTYVYKITFNKGSVVNFTDADGNSYGLCQQWWISQSDIKQMFLDIAALENFDLLSNRNYSNDTFPTREGDDYMYYYYDELEIILAGAYRSNQFRTSWNCPSSWQWTP